MPTHHEGLLTGRRRMLGALAWLACALGTAGNATAATEVSPAVWSGVERVVAFADVHGAHEELTALLQSVGVIDAGLRWSGGKTHLVSLGDLLDRGADSRKVMDLLMRLQAEATAAGGRVHVVLGNHETMNVLGDLRYVAADEFAAFFAHRRLLGPQGRYGEWLLGLPAAVHVNDTVYMHGGPSALLHDRGIERLNRDYASVVNEYLAAESALRDAGLIEPEDAYAQRPDVAAGRLQALPPGPSRDALASAVERLRRADDDPLLGPTGPNWYRGAALCNECAEADVLRPFLGQTGARRVVVGHTVARNATVVSRFDGAVVKLDAGMNRAVYRGRPAALVSEGATSRVAYALPTVPPAAVPPEPLYLSSQAIDEAAVADVLARGSIETTLACAPGVLETRVTLDGRSVDAIFEAASPEAVKREMAAYRLDRALGLGLVPATVAREHAGQAGLLQGRPANWASEQDRQNARSGLPDHHGRAAGRAGAAAAAVRRQAAAAAGRRLVRSRRAVPARLCVRRADRQPGAHAGALPL